jgi:colanic acid/amylovoran biosynthesis glycosyltransferase
MTVPQRSGRPGVAVYRQSLLEPSETFIRSETLALERYDPVFIGDQRSSNGLALPADRVVTGTPGGRWQRALRRRLPGHDPQGRLARACRERGVVLVHGQFGANSLPALDLAEALALPFVVSYWGFDASMTDAALRAFPEYEPYLRRREELFAKVSQFLAGELVRQGAPEEKLRVHHVGVALGRPRGDVPREPVVLFVGRHVEKKGLGDLLDAMVRVRAAVPAARLLIVGDGPLRGELEAHARRLALGAEFAGWLAPEDVARRLREVRVLCVPSRRAANGDAEGLPTVIPEAAAEGLPVVGTRHSGIPEGVVDGRSGLLAAEGDPEDLASRLTAVLTDDELWRRLSDGAREHVAEHFDPRRQAAELEAIYDEAVARP